MLVRSYAVTSTMKQEQNRAERVMLCCHSMQGVNGWSLSHSGLEIPSMHELRCTPMPPIEKLSA